MNLLKKNTSFLFQILLCFFITQIGFAQFTIPEIPKFQTSVYDYANVLSADEKSQLEEKLIKYSDSTTTQIVVITIESLKGEDVSQLATKWGQTWGIGGTAKDDNGVIILLAKAERKISIRPGYGVEDRLVAGICGEIIRNVIVPEIKAGSIYNGLDKGTDTIIKVLKGKYKGTRKGNKDDGGGIPIIFFIILFIIILVIISKNNKGNGSGIGRTPSLLDVIILSSMGRSGGGSFGGSSGGGFSGGGGFGGGFGGGGFSGGGASGGW